MPRLPLELLVGQDSRALTRASEPGSLTMMRMRQESTRATTLKPSQGLINEGYYMHIRICACSVYDDKATVDKQGCGAYEE